MMRLIYDASAKDLPDLDEEALAWVVRLTSGNSTSDDHDDFRRWRDQSVEHVHALARAQLLWRQISVAVPEVVRRQSDRWSDRRLRLAFVAFSLAASIMLSVGIGIQYWRVWRFDAVTQVAERRRLVLPDGSLVVLGGDTALKLDFKPGIRRIDLARGEAVFQVRHDARRPFIVNAGSVKVRDVGTVFDVALVDDRAKIVVSQGIVETSEDDRRIVLTANESLSASPGRLGDIHRVDAQMETAWVRGRLILENKTLGDIIEALRPYYRGRIVSLNPATARQRLSAVIELDRIDDWLDALATSRAVRLNRVGSVTVLR